MIELIKSDSIKEKSKLTKEEWREYTKNVWQIANISDPAHPAPFPPEIPHRLIKLFTFVNEIVLDPFAGVGNTAVAALPLYRKAICIDENLEYVKIMQNRLLNTYGHALTIYCADSRKMDFIHDNTVGLVVTSPPYWNKANYSSSDTNLGNIGNYDDFFNQIKPVLEQCYRVLIPGRKICIVTANVNQYTDHGLLTFPLAADFIDLLRSIGFLMINEIIWSKDGTGGKWGSWGKQRPIFGSYPYPPNFYFKNIHEHILVFAKPPGKLVNNPKAKKLSQIMPSHMQPPS